MIGYKFGGAKVQGSLFTASYLRYDTATRCNFLVKYSMQIASERTLQRMQNLQLAL